MKPEHSKLPLDASESQTFRYKCARNVPARQMPSASRCLGSDPIAKCQVSATTVSEARHRYARLRRAISEIRSLLRTPSPPEACVPISIPPGLRRSGRRRVESGHRGKPVAYRTSYKLILRLRRPPRRSLERITRSPERQSLSTMCCGEAARWVGMNFYCVFRTTQFDIAR